MTLDRTDLAWLAGLLDGEGCFDTPRGNPRVRVKMSDHDVVLRAADIMSARTYPEIVEGRKPLLVAQVTGKQAVAVLRAILPFLGARRTTKATEIILAFQVRTGERPPLRILTGEAA